METGGIVEALRRLQVPHDRIAATIGRDRTAATKLVNGIRRVQPTEIEPLLALVEEFQKARDPFGGPFVPRPTRAAPSIAADYVPVEVVPIFADEPPSRALVHQDTLTRLGAQPGDVRLVRVRGPAMEPEFLNGDVVLVDLRDRAVEQGGPFALFLDAGQYAIRNVQRLRDGRLRVAATNPKLPICEEVDADAVEIMGRPVWVSRFL